MIPDSETAALLRTVLDEVCAQLPSFDASTRTNVASRLLDAVKQGRCSVDDLREVGQKALYKTPTMWR